MLGGRRHHLITFKGKGLSLQAVVIIIFLLFLTGVISFVRVPLIEGIEVILFNQGLEKKKKKSRKVGSVLLLTVKQGNTQGTNCSKICVLTPAFS